MKKKTSFAFFLFLILMMALPISVQASWKKSSNGNYYYYNSAGKLQKNKWIGRRYVDSTGKWVQNRSFIERTKYAKSLSQLIIVEGSGTTAKVSLHAKSPKGNWYIKWTTNGHIGSRGLGKKVEGDRKTPVGMFTMSKAFGILPDPGTAFRYNKVDSTWYWVGDSSSQYYNRLVTTRHAVMDWNDAEHIIDYKTAYRYVLSIDYNKNRVPGKGSAIFLHCSTGGPTAGCVSISEKAMKKLLCYAKPGIRIAIGSASSLKTMFGY